MVEIEEIGGELRMERIGAHSHIKGLGLDENGRAKQVADGLVGQTRAREAAGLVVMMAKEGKLSGKAVLLAGPPGTGKTAIAVAMARELGEDVPFIQLSGSEIYSTERKKTEVLMEAMRKAIGVKVRELRKVYEGEVKEMDIKMGSSPYNPFVKVPQEAVITLKTTEEEKRIRVGPNVARQLVEFGIAEGDVIMIDAKDGRVSKVGRSTESFSYDLEAEQLVPRPEGPVLKEKEFVYVLTLDDLDRMVARRRSGGGLFSLLFGVEEKELDPEVRAAVDQQVKEWVEMGRAEIVPGVMFIDDAHLMDIEALSFISRAMESELVPIIVMATNRGITKIRGTEIEAPFGVPLDLLDRLVIITTDKYSKEEIGHILRIRAKEEGVKLRDDALELLMELGAEKSLRYAVQILGIAGVRTRAKGKEEIGREDVKEVAKRFSDVREAVDHLRRYEEELLK
ncbi:MAG: RuvB-like domain-containing protein [Candidatus Korarchaeota archaeon]|nr:RuvB-like domain-containing protein [Candidatus Korarchaeota archaeon]